MTTSTTTPAGATGAVFGEGAGVLVLENLDHARQRGAAIAGEIVGIGQSHSLSTVYDRLEQDGKGLQIAIEKALADAEIDGDPYGDTNPDELRGFCSLVLSLTRGM